VTNLGHQQSSSIEIN